jgi:hypothetical protein
MSTGGARFDYPIGQTSPVASQHTYTTRRSDASRIPNQPALRSGRNPGQKRPKRIPKDAEYTPLSDADLSYLVLNIQELSQKPRANALVMQQVRFGGKKIRELILEHILHESAAADMITDKLSCRVLASLLARGNDDQRARLIASLEDYMNGLAADQFGCTFIQSALEELDVDARAPIVSELLETSENAVAAVIHRFGRFVMLKLVDVASPEELALLWERIAEDVGVLCRDRVGCVFINRCLQRFPTEERRLLIDALLDNEDEIMVGCQHQYAHFVYEHIVKHGTVTEFDRMCEVLKGHTRELSLNESANFVVRAIISSGTDEHIRDRLVDELLSWPDTLLKLSQSPWGTLVVQELVRSGQEHYGLPVAEMVKDHLADLITDEHGRFVVACALGLLSPEAAAEACLGYLSYKGRIIATAADPNGRFLIVQILAEGLGGSVVSTRVAEALQGNVISLATSMSGCHSVKAAVRYLSGDERQVLVDELLCTKESILDCVKDRYARHVVEYLLEHGTEGDTERIADAFRGEAMSLALHKRAQSTIKTALETMPKLQRNVLIAELRSDDSLVEDLRKSRNGAEIVAMLYPRGAAASS